MNLKLYKEILKSLATGSTKGLAVALVDEQIKAEREAELAKNSQKIFLAVAEDETGKITSWLGEKPKDDAEHQNAKIIIFRTAHK